MAKTRFTLVVTRDPHSKAFNVDVPEIPGCHSWGHTRSQAISSGKKMIALCLETEDASEHAPEPAEIYKVEVS
jgi:predicted RNase H-like HicB family nuclease